MANNDAQSPAGPGALKKRWLSTSTMMTVVFCSLYFLMYLDRVNIAMAANSIIKDFKLSHVELGLAFSAFSWPYLIGQWVGGWSANKIGAKLTLALCVLVAGVATFFSGIVVGLATLFAARLFVGIGEGPVFSAATQGMKHWYSGKRYGYIQGVTHAAARLGGARATHCGRVHRSVRLAVIFFRVRHYNLGLACLLVVSFYRRPPGPSADHRGRSGRAGTPFQGGAACPHSLVATDKAHPPGDPGGFYLRLDALGVSVLDSPLFHDSFSPELKIFSLAFRLRSRSWGYWR